MKPEPRPTIIKTHMLVSLDKTCGTFILTTMGVTEPGDMGIGFYSSLDKAQKQQLVLALKGIQTEVFTIEYPLPV